MVLIPNVSRTLFWILAAPPWIACAVGILWWHGSVTPGLDGSEGAGAGFGCSALHCAAPLLAAGFTALLGAIDRLLKLHARPAFLPL